MTILMDPRISKTSIDHVSKITIKYIINNFSQISDSWDFFATLSHPLHTIKFIPEIDMLFLS